MNKTAVYRRLTERRINAGYEATEDAIRDELIKEVRAAIFNDTAAWSSTDIERMAEIAVDTFVEFFCKRPTSLT